VAELGALVAVAVVLAALNYRNYKMKRIKGLDINETDRVYEMSSGVFIKVRVLKHEVKAGFVSFKISCSDCDDKGKAMPCVDGHVLGQETVLSIPVGSKNPMETLEKAVLEKLNNDEKYFKSFYNIEKLAEKWQND